MIVHIDSGPGLSGKLEIEQDQIDVTTRTERDPNWTFVDQSGHFHAWSADGELPTLRSETRHVDCDGMHTDGYEPEGECEGYDVTDYLCAICGEQVKPGYRDTVGRRYTNGHTWWSVELTSDRRYEGTVSVRIVDGDTTRFGIAQATDVSMESTINGGVRITTRLVAASALGERGTAS